MLDGMPRVQQKLRNDWLTLHNKKYCTSLHTSPFFPPPSRFFLPSPLQFQKQRPIIAGRMLSTLRLTTLTYIGREQQKKLNQILTYLMQLPDCTEFINPVDWQQLQLNDYPLIVKNPMHLLKVQDKLKAREYRTVEEVLDHIQLIWDNCKLYNPEGHYFIMADKMERSFKKMIRNYLPNIQVVVPKPVGSTPSLPEKYQPPPPNPRPASKIPPRVTHPPTYNPPKETQEEPHDFNDKPESAEVDEIPQAEKNRFHQRLKQLTQQQLGNIIYMIQENCSEGYKELGGGRGQIHLDSIDSETFRKLNGKLDDMLDGEKMMGSKKIKS